MGLFPADAEDLELVAILHVAATHHVQICVRIVTAPSGLAGLNVNLGVTRLGLVQGGHDLAVGVNRAALVGVGKRPGSVRVTQPKLDGLLASEFLMQVTLAALQVRVRQVGVLCVDPVVAFHGLVPKPHAGVLGESLVDQASDEFPYQRMADLSLGVAGTAVHSREGIKGGLHEVGVCPWSTSKLRRRGRDEFPQAVDLLMAHDRFDLLR